MSDEDVAAGTEPRIHARAQPLLELRVERKGVAGHQAVEPSAPLLAHATWLHSRGSGTDPVPFVYDDAPDVALREMERNGEACDAGADDCDVAGQRKGRVGLRSAARSRGLQSSSTSGTWPGGFSVQAKWQAARWSDPGACTSGGSSSCAERRLRDRAARMEAAASREVERARRVADDARPLGARGRARAAGRPAASPACRGGGDRRTARSVGAVSTMRPRYMTATRSHTWRTTARLCAISSMRQAELLAQLREQVQNRRLHRDVERRDRLVGDQELGLESERARDRDALALAARELPRVGVERRGLSPTRSSSSRQRASTRSRGTTPCARAAARASVCRTVIRGFSDE